MFEGLFIPKTMPIDEYMPLAPYPIYPTGVKDEDKSINRYALPKSAYPTLILIDPIYDAEGNYIAPGHYELGISDDLGFLFLIQSKQLVAVFPVFKVEEDKEQNPYYDKRTSSKDKKTKKKRIKQSKKEQKKENRLKLKYARKNESLPERYTYMNAEIEYNKEDNFFMILYENRGIRAWSAVKSYK